MPLQIGSTPEFEQHLEDAKDRMMQFNRMQINGWVSESDYSEYYSIWKPGMADKELLLQLKSLQEVN